MFPLIFRALAGGATKRTMAQVIAPKIASALKTSGAVGSTKTVIRRLATLQYEAEVRGIASPFSEEFAAQVGKEKANGLPRMLRDVQRELRSRGVAGDLSEFTQGVLGEGKRITEVKKAMTDAAVQDAVDSINTHRANIGSPVGVTEAEVATLRRELPRLYADQDKVLDAIASNLQPEGTDPGEVIELMKREARDPRKIKAVRYAGKRVPIVSPTGSGRDLAFRRNILTAIAGSDVSREPVVAAILIENFMAMSPTKLMNWARENSNMVSTFFGGFTYNVGKGSIVEVMDSLVKYNGLDDWRTRADYFVDPTDTTDSTTNFVFMYHNNVSIQAGFGLTGVADDKLADFLSSTTTRGKGQGQEESLTRRPTAGFKPRFTRK